MKTRFAILALALAASTSGAHAAPRTEIIPAQGGPIRITPIFHGSLQIEYRGNVIHVDPFSAGDYSTVKRADIVLITHTHGDHLDLKALVSVVGKMGGSLIYAPRAAVATLKSGGYPEANGSAPILIPSVIAMANYGKAEVGLSDKTRDYIRIEAVPMYNVVRGPKPGQKFHPKGQFNGYVLSMGGKRIYIAGDTEATPEMRALKNIDVAFLPMNLPYTMTPQEAASGARAFKPKVVYPYHYRSPFDKKNANPQQFAAALQGTGIQVRIRDWYANPARSN